MRLLYTVEPLSKLVSRLLYDGMYEHMDISMMSRRCSGKNILYTTG